MKFKKLVMFFSGILDPPFLEGVLIDNRYKVVIHLGSGGFGHSYLVVDQQTNGKVVLKALRLHRRLSRSGRKAFEHEKDLLKSINHPGFPRYLQNGSHKRIPYYTMDFIEGQNFEQLIFDEGKQYTELESFKIAHQLLALIHVLHSKMIIHRDIRIPNVIANGPNIWLIDLGLAIRGSGELVINERKQRNLRKQLNNQADFISLGHFILFLLYSNFTFPKGSKERSWEEELEISQQAKLIIRKLLEIETQYQNCKQIQKDIEKLILNGEGKHVVF